MYHRFQGNPDVWIGPPDNAENKLSENARLMLVVAKYSVIGYFFTNVQITSAISSCGSSYV